MGLGPHENGKPDIKLHSFLEWLFICSEQKGLDWLHMTYMHRLDNDDLSNDYRFYEILHDLREMPFGSRP